MFIDSWYFSASDPRLLTRRYTTCAYPGSHRPSANKSVASCTVFHSESVPACVSTTVAYSSSTSRLPAVMVLRPLVTLSVNHANVVPISIAAHTTNAKTLATSVRRVCLLLDMTSPPFVFLFDFYTVERSRMLLIPLLRNGIKSLCNTVHRKGACPFDVQSRNIFAVDTNRHSFRRTEHPAGSTG